MTDAHISTGAAINFGVIERARARQRRRRAYTVLGLAALVVGALAYAHAHRSQRQPATLSERGIARMVDPGAVLAQPPYMGVACHLPNAISCDRVGLAIWLRRPAVSVAATIAGRPLKLDWRGDRQPRFAARHPRRAFDGFLQPAGLRNGLGVRPDVPTSLDAGCACQTGPLWFGENAPAPPVRLWIDYGDGITVVTQLNVSLAAGWG